LRLGSFKMLGEGDDVYFRTQFMDTSPLDIVRFRSQVVGDGWRTTLVCAA
jgi:hypothetical protein